MSAIQREISKPIFFSTFFSGISMQVGAIILITGALLFQFNMREYLTTSYLFATNQTETIKGKATFFEASAWDDDGYATEFSSSYKSIPHDKYGVISDWCFYSTSKKAQRFLLNSQKIILVIQGLSELIEMVAPSL